MYNDNDRKSDFQWFVDNYEEIYNKYGVCHIGIRNKTILGVYQDKNVGLNDLSDKYGLGNFSLQHCNGDESGYTVHIYTPYYLMGI